LRLLNEAKCSILVQRRIPQNHQPVVVFMDDSPLGWRSLALSIQMAAQRQARLVVVTPEIDDRQFLELCRKVEGKLSPFAIDARFVKVPGDNVQSLLSVVTAERGRALILGAQLLQQKDWNILFGGLRCAVVLVR